MTDQNPRADLEALIRELGLRGLSQEAIVDLVAAALSRPRSIQDADDEIVWMEGPATRIEDVEEGAQINSDAEFGEVEPDWDPSGIPGAIDETT